MASTAVELLRRRFGGKKAPKVVRGSFTVAEDSTTQTITHNIGTLNYVVLYRNKNYRTNVNSVMEGIVVCGMSKYKPYIGSSYRDTVSVLSEARGGSRYSSVSNSSQPDSYRTENTIILAARNSTYKFLAGDEFDWIVISLDNVGYKTTKTLDTASQYMSVGNNLGTTDIFSICLIDSPTFTVDGCLVSLNHNAYLTNLQATCFEVRTTYNNYCSPFTINAPTITDSTVEFRTRSNAYKFETGDYTILMTKI